MKNCGAMYKWVAIFAVLGLVFISCGGDKTKADGAGINGIWKSDNGEITISINFNGESKSIEMEGKNMPVTIEESASENTVKLNVKEDENTVSKWVLQKMWNDNGSDFKLILMLPDGSRKALNREGHS